jgi:AcrR family transcriptional regulator
MGRPSTIDNDDIVAVARHLFLTEGPSVATARIAAKCQISEGTLFKRFGSKDHLFERAMLFPCLEATLKAIHQTTEGEDSAESIKRVTLALLSFFRELIPRMMTLWASHTLDPRKMLQGKQSPPRLLLHEVEQFLVREKSKGQIQISDPEVVARMLLSTMHNLAFFETMGIPSIEDNTEETYVNRMLLVMGLVGEGRQAT